MKYVVSYGVLYRLTNRDYERLLRTIAAGEGDDLERCGRRVGTVHDITELTPAMAGDYLCGKEVKDTL